MEHLTKICKIVWKELSIEEEEAYYYDTGMYGFIRDVARLLHMNMIALTDEDLEALSKELMWM